MWYLLKMCLTASFQNFSLKVEEKTKKNEYEVSGFCKTVKIKQAGEKKKKKVSSENLVIKYIIE